MPESSASITEGRANLARPSLCLFIAAVAVFLLAESAPAAAQPKPLALSGTNPKSSQAEPANTTTLRILGGEEGATTTVVRLGAGRLLPIAAAGTPTNVVDIYTDAQCKSVPVATGSLSELEEPGIQVEVPPDSQTTFYANQAEASEPSNPSECSAPGLTYYESSTIVSPPKEESSGGGGGAPAENHSGASANPPIAPRLHTVPAGRANNNAPRIVGSAPDAERVKVFDNSSCSGSPILNVSVGELSSGAVVHVSDNSVTDFAGISVTGGKQSFCSPPATYIEDSSPPHVRITMAPGAKTRRHKAVVRFADTSAESSGTSFACRVNHRKWKPCHSPLKLRHLRFHRYVLRVRGTDAIGNTEAKPAKRSFKVIH